MRKAPAQKMMSLNFFYGKSTSTPAASSASLTAKRPLEAEGQATKRHAHIDLPIADMDTSTPNICTEAAMKLSAPPDEVLEPPDAHTLDATAVVAAINATSPGMLTPVASKLDTGVPIAKARPPSAEVLAKREAAAKATPLPSDIPVTDSRHLSWGFLRDKRDASGRRPGESGYDKSTLLVKLRGDEKFTPGQEQYWSIKAKNNDVVVFFKVGKFYELFEEDALVGHRELDLAFMGKDAPHVGFPEAVLNKYAEKLVSIGYKVRVAAAALG